MSRPTKIALKSERFDNRQFEAIQRNAQEAHLALNRLPFSDGQAIAATFTPGQALVLTHHLGRVPQGFFCIDAYGGYGAFTRDQTSTGTTTTTIKIQSQNAGTFTFWVY